MRRFQKWWAVLYTSALLSFSTYAVLDTFVIPKAYATETQAVFSEEAVSESASSEEVVSESASSETDASEQSEADIRITEYQAYGSAIYVADIYTDSVNNICTAFADGTYGKNITAKTSEIAESVDAALAINGDFYGAQESGYVIRNGVLYRSSSRNGQEDLVIWQDGSFEIIQEEEVTAQELIDKGAWQVFSFGPALLENGETSVSESDEVDQAMTSNPRTAIGIVEEGHYVMVVSDGRTEESEGLSLYELACFLQTLGVETAYNLDGGGSSTMVSSGNVVNQPTSGHGIKERSVSDIIYISDGR